MIGFKGLFRYKAFINLLPLGRLPELLEMANNVSDTDTADVLLMSEP